MTFHDLKLPKELSKKKKLDLYKCWILDPLDEGSDQRILDLNVDRDRYGLTQEAAFHLAINQLGADYIIENLDLSDMTNFMSNKLVVIMKITLLAGSMDEEVIIPPDSDTTMSVDPGYDPILGILTVTVRHRIADTELKNYAVDSITIEIDNATRIINITELSLREQIINKALTGGK